MEARLAASRAAVVNLMEAVVAELTVVEGKVKKGETTQMTAKEIIKLAVFEGKRIRKIIHDGEWWFAVVDVVEVLTASPTPRQYWGKIKKREFTDLQLSPVWVQLKLEASDGKKYATDCANTKN